MIVVSNTSPILNLVIVGQLDILKSLYQRVYIPKAVFYEISDYLFDKPDRAFIETFPWIEIRPINNHSLFESLSLELHEGEAEAITLALEMKSDLLLLDERHGYDIASRLNIKSIGLLGSLIEAKHNKVISLVKPILDDLIIKAGFWISKDLYNHVLKIAGE
ncbi:MAG: DUF3368 domain-containing protein [Candidatus Poribacteria bacterium]